MTKYIYAPLSALLTVAGFIVPPIGQIDPSVLTAVGLMLGFKAIDTIPDLARRGTDVTVQHGQTSVTVNNPDPEKE